MQLTKAGLGIIPSLGSVAAQSPNAAATPPSAAGAFGDVLKNMVGSTMDAQNAAQQMSAAAASGQDVPMQQVVQALSQAELSLQTLITVRDKAIEAYQAIQQMPI